MSHTSTCILTILNHILHVEMPTASCFSRHNLLISTFFAPSDVQDDHKSFIMAASGTSNISVVVTQVFDVFVFSLDDMK